MIQRNRMRKKLSEKLQSVMVDKEVVMKRLLCITLCFIAVLPLSGCFKNENEDVLPADAVSSKSVSQYSDKTDNTESSITEEISYPAETDEVDSDSLRFKSKDGKIIAVFPKMFWKKSDDFKSESGIYLSTTDGNATLEIDYIKSEGITKESFVEYLEKKYKSSKADTTDPKYIIFSTKIKDKKNNVVIMNMKALLKEDGYSEAVLCYHESDKDKYTDLLQKIEIQ